MRRKVKGKVARKDLVDKPARGEQEPSRRWENQEKGAPKPAGSSPKEP